MNFGYHFRKITNNSGQFVKYLTLQTQVQALRGQMLYRSKNLGVKQLDLIVGSWALNFLKTLNKQQLLQYNTQVIQQQTPDLTKKLLGEMPIHDSQFYLQEIRKFALNQKYSKLEFI